MIAPAPSDVERVAVIGAGVSGLVCAALLRERFDVTVFEAGDHIGGHTRTIDLDDPDGAVGVDTGFIVYNETNYPNFTKLLKRLGVRSRPSDMSLSVRDDRIGLEYNGSSLRKLFAQRRNILRPSHHRMIRDILRFFRESPALLDGPDDTLTVLEYVRRERYSDAFLDRYLLPIGASLWSCPEGTFLGFPIRFVVEFFHNHGMLRRAGRPEWRVIDGGSARYVEALTAGWRDRIRLRTPVASVERSASSVTITTTAGYTHTCDHVVIACHTDQALAMLADPSDAEREILGAIPYSANRTVLHTDTSLLPRRRRAWASWNYHAGHERDHPATLTYNMNMLQSLETRETYCVTLNEQAKIDTDRKLRAFDDGHPVFSAGKADAQKRHDELINANRSSYCGAYWGYGFHEDGVRSALRVCGAFGVSL
ncbi:MAG: FAD-dependent oxidoreductase [Phycisphaerales bacterium]